MSQPTPVTMSFNPTAVTMLCNDAKDEAVRQHIESRTGKKYTDALQPGKHYVAFMGDVYVLDEAQLHAAMGRV